MKRFVLRTEQDKKALHAAGQVRVWCGARSVPARFERVLVDGVKCVCQGAEQSNKDATMTAWTARKDVTA